MKKEQDHVLATVPLLSSRTQACRVRCTSASQHLLLTGVKIHRHCHLIFNRFQLCARHSRDIVKVVIYSAQLFHTGIRLNRIKHISITALTWESHLSSLSTFTWHWLVPDSWPCITRNQSPHLAALRRIAETYATTYLECLTSAPASVPLPGPCTRFSRFFLHWPPTGTG